MTKFLYATLAPLTALGLLLASPAASQTTAQDSHHPGDAAASSNDPSPPGQMTPMMGQMMGGGMGHPMMGMMMDHPAGYVAFLQTEMGITSAQNGVWKAYSDQLMAMMKQHQDKVPMMRDTEAKPRSWIERLADSETRIGARLEAIKKIQPAATALYAALTPEQKQKADALLPGGMGMAGMMGGMKMRGMH